MTTSTHTHPAATMKMKKPFPFIGMDPAPQIASYHDVPWYRRAWFAFFPLFFPALIVIALTGDVFHRATGGMRKYSDAEVWRYSRTARMYLVVQAVAAGVFFLVVGLDVV